MKRYLISFGNTTLNFPETALAGTIHDVIAREGPNTKVRISAIDCDGADTVLNHAYGVSVYSGPAAKALSATVLYSIGGKEPERWSITASLLKEVVRLASDDELDLLIDEATAAKERRANPFNLSKDDIKAIGTLAEPIASAVRRLADKGFSPWIDANGTLCFARSGLQSVKAPDERAVDKDAALFSTGISIPFAGGSSRALVPEK